MTVWNEDTWAEVNDEGIVCEPLNGTPVRALGCEQILRLINPHNILNPAIWKLFIRECENYDLAFNGN